MTSIFQPLAARPESSTAICAASVEPAPPRSEYKPELSVSTPILMFLSCANAPVAATSESAVPRKSAESCCFMLSPWSVFLERSSDAEIGVELVHVGLEIRIGETVDHLAVLHDVVAVRHGRGEAEVLLDQEDGET